VTKETRNKSHCGQSVSWLRYDAVAARIGVKWMFLGSCQTQRTQLNRTVSAHTK